jgi:hypothetical protein
VNSGLFGHPLDLGLTGGLPELDEIVVESAGSNGGQIDLKNIDHAYKHLLLLARLRGDANAAGVNVFMQLNSDAGPNYAYQHLNGANTGVSANVGIGQTKGFLGDCAAATAPGGQFGLLVVFFPFTTVEGNSFNGSGMNRAWFSLNHDFESAVAAGLEVRLIGGQWGGQTPINKINLQPSSGNFDVGSRAALYGL